MTTFELRNYRRQLEIAIAYYDRMDSVPQDVQRELATVRAEQESRASTV
jgi:hypothetical protein